MKLRFAPSPTGYLHVGGARTAIFNLLHARRYGGKLLLRIEDTDVERSKQHHAEQIVSSLEWLGIDWDEGPIYQSDRLDRYRERANELVDQGAAYRCYCTVDDLEAERAAAERQGVAYRYSGRCRSAAPSDATATHVIRFKVPPGAIEFHDLIRGDVRFEGELIDDFVLLRSDHNPTYHLSVVVDDIDMAITHVARGDDHLSNTPKHILLFRAFGAAEPVFAHLPLILGSDRKRLSKRTGATSVEEYQSMGVLPEALFNFLTLLGWSPGGDREIISATESAALFDLSDVNKAPAVFDVDKLLWVNAQYMMTAAAERLEHFMQPFVTFDTSDRQKLRSAIELHRPRARTLRELAESISIYYIDDDAFTYDGEAVRKHVKGDDLATKFSQLESLFEAVEPFDVVTTEAELRSLAERSGASAAKYIHPLRVALTGKSASPPIFDVAVVLGREKCLRRIRRIISLLPELTVS